MELEVYTAFTKAGIPDDVARAAVDSIKKEIDSRYALHSTQLATKSDLAEAKAEIIKWCMGAIFGSAGMTIAIVKLLS
ncbi:DUF1640 domain-containing protein [Comamonadaceae bacterium OH2545_COT-014]|nr:DUF1640 domain-containing protein [Comamonadaceae bacterium OH2545_COT-014]